ncbi:MAG: hypothetical protein SXU28_14260 [Pseudomonadota bacterium]|nr:hypothetical protein [Pseudomonadota bacterium]
MSENKDALQEVVAKAYAAIGEPQSFVPLLNELLDADEKLGGIGNLGDMHFENAEAIFDKVYPLADADYSQMLRHLEHDLECDLALDENLRVLTFSTRLFGEKGLERESFAPEWLFDPVRIDEDQKRLKNAQADEDRLFLRLFMTPDDEAGRWFCAFRVPIGGVHVIALQLVRLRWDESSASAFREAFELTSTELELTKHLVKGGTTREFAEIRGRSVGTARNQLKALQRKLVINSKEQLLLLYAGFIHSLDPPESEEDSIDHVCANLFCDSQGQTIAWEEYGDPDGLPVVFFHALEGPLMVSSVDRAAREAGLRIIGPWRPHYGGTSGNGPSPNSPVEFAERLPEFLDYLGVDRVVALGTQAGTPFLAAFAKHQADRVIKAIAAGPFLPIVKSDDYRFMKTRQRSHFRIARVAPAFARVYMRAMLASMGTGEFHKFVEDFYDGCSREAKSVQHPEKVRNFRKAANYVLPRGKMGPGDTMTNWSAQWGGFLEGLGERLVMLVGSEDSNTPPEFARLSAERFALPEPQVLPDAGSFLIEDKPRDVFEQVRLAFD